MAFHNKLNFLTKLTNTTNSALSMYLSLDASHISRLRSGERKLVRNADYIKKMAVYFTRQCVEQYQIKALLEAMKISPVELEDAEKTTELIYQWLIDHERTETNYVTKFLNELSVIPSICEKKYERSIPISKPVMVHSNLSLYYGIIGKREAVLEFLSLVLESGNPDILLLYSDESMDWLTEDPVFFEKWATMLCKIIAQGNKIKIIHTVSRNLDEMLEALSKWMPLYMTGGIEPFYYPKKRDGIFKRTMFISPQKAAVTATSIDNMIDEGVNILLQESKAIHSLAQEFYSYLNFCKPLMRIFTNKDSAQYLNTLEEFEKEAADAFVKSGHLSLATMPMTVVNNIINRSSDIKNVIMSGLFLKRKERFESNIKENCFYEIIQLPDLHMIKEGKIAIDFSGLQEFSGDFYQPDEYKAHLINIIQCLHKFENYQVVINRDPRRDDYRLYVKEDIGVIVVKTGDQNVVFAINESNMTATFWDYLNIIYNENKQNKKSVIKQLQELVDQL